MKKIFGYSLLELMIVLFISSFAFLMLFVQIEVVSKVKKNLENVALAEEDFLNLSGLIRRIGYRGRYVQFNHFPSAGFPAATGNYKVMEKGYVILLADLTPCLTFSPSTADNALVKILLQCCDATVPPPTAAFVNSIPGPAMPAATMNSKCGPKGGLSITSSNGAIQYCYEHISALTVSRAGFHNGFASDLFQTQVRSKRSFTEHENKKRALNVFWGLGNTGATAITYCQEVVGN